MTIQEAIRKVKEACETNYKELGCTKSPIIRQNGYVIEVVLDSHKDLKLTDSEIKLAKNISKTCSKGYRIKWFL